MEESRKYRGQRTRIRLVCGMSLLQFPRPTFYNTLVHSLWQDSAIMKVLNVSKALTVSITPTRLYHALPSVLLGLLFKILDAGTWPRLLHFEFHVPTERKYLPASYFSF